MVRNTPLNVLRGIQRDRPAAAGGAGENDVTIDNYFIA